MLKQFYLGREFLFSCDESFKPYRKVFDDKTGDISKEELDKFLVECRKHYTKIVKDFPEITWEELIDIDTMNDIVTVCRRLDANTYYTIKNEE